jgi:putative transferase (TIGR04331 family)
LVARTLITTPEELTWPTDKDEKILFLGEWCKCYSRKNYWNELDFKTVKYHWDDREKFYQDYRYIDGIYEMLLRDLSKHLNQFHEVNYPLRYWRIVIGPWLVVFIETLFDRWFMLKVSIEEYDIKKCIIFNKNIVDIIPDDINQFNQMSVNDYWNESIYGYLLSNYFNNDLKVIKIPNSSKLTKKIHFRKVNNYKIKIFIKKIVSKIEGFFYKSDKYFLTSTYMPLFQSIKLQFYLGQVPKFINSDFRIIKYPAANLKKRQWKVVKTEDDFLNIVYDMVLLNIPIAYLEGYKGLSKYTENLKWPKYPEVIFTSQSWFSDEAFKIWSANKCESGARLVIGQHGGNFGMTDLSVHEKHQIDIADQWISWGWDWSKISHTQVVPAFNLKITGKTVKYNPKGSALLVAMSMPRYSQRLLSCTIASQWLYYFDDICNFIEVLPNKIQENIVVRFSCVDHGWKSKDRLSDRIPKVKIGAECDNIIFHMKRSRIYISTYNATTYLESLSYNFPTLIFWDETFWEVSDEIVHYFDLLESVGIFHKSPEKAAKKMEEVWDDIPMWWNSREVQEARKIFCEVFSRNSRTPINDIGSILKNSRYT